MTWYYVLYLCVLLLMPVVDTALIRAQRRSVRPRRLVERRSLFILWFCASAGFAAAFFLRTVAAGRIPLPRPFLAALAVAAMLAGMGLRWAAMLALGRYFSPHIEIAAGQPLTTTGLYRHVRHPAYAGIILVFIGIGVAFENWLSLLAVSLPVIGAISHRVKVEEAALLEHFGGDYKEYADRTKRFLPFVI
jgi:protein-S-isoprenylcysteine O-methyltransferase Ste14